MIFSTNLFYIKMENGIKQMIGDMMNIKWMKQYNPDSKTRLWSCDMIRFMDEMK